MHAPWLQVANEVLDQAAPDIAALLEWSEDSAIVGLLRLFRWALGRCPETAPPSANDVVHGPAAAKLVANAARFRGDPEAFVTACEQVRPAVLERVDGGIRVRGLDRYDALWGKSHPKEWAEFKVRNVSGAEPERNRPGSDPEPVPQIQIQTQKEDQKLSSAPPPPSAPEQVELIPGPTPDDVRNLWNERAASPLPRMEKLTEDRRRRAKVLLKDYGLSHLAQAIARINASPFLLGAKGGWRAGPDWFLKPANVQKLLEGAYTDAPVRPAANPDRDVGRHEPVAGRCDYAGCEDPPSGIVWGRPVCYAHREQARLDHEAKREAS